MAYEYVRHTCSRATLHSFCPLATYFMSVGSTTIVSLADRVIEDISDELNSIPLNSIIEGSERNPTFERMPTFLNDNLLFYATRHPPIPANNLEVVVFS